MLSDEEIDAIGSERSPYTDFQFARAIESAATAPLLARIAELELEVKALTQDREVLALEGNKLTRELEEARKDAERYRWLRDRNSHHQFRSAWISSVTAVKDGPCDIFSADEVPALLDSEIDRRMAAIRAAIKEQT